MRQTVVAATASIAVGFLIGPWSGLMAIWIALIAWLFTFVVIRVLEEWWLQTWWIYARDAVAYLARESRHAKERRPIETTIIDYFADELRSAAKAGTVRALGRVPRHLIKRLYPPTDYWEAAGLDVSDLDDDHGSRGRTKRLQYGGSFYTLEDLMFRRSDLFTQFPRRDDFATYR